MLSQIIPFLLQACDTNASERVDEDSTEVIAQIDVKINHSKIFKQAQNQESEQTENFSNSYKTIKLTTPEKKIKVVDIKYDEKRKKGGWKKRLKTVEKKKDGGWRWRKKKVKKNEMKKGKESNNDKQVNNKEKQVNKVCIEIKENKDDKYDQKKEENNKEEKVIQQKEEKIKQIEIVEENIIMEPKTNEEKIPNNENNQEDKIDLDTLNLNTKKGSWKDRLKNLNKSKPPIK